MIPISRLLNAVTMYRLIVYGLAGLAIVSLVVSLTGRFSFTAGELVLSFGLLLGSAFSANVIFSRLWRVPTNRESWLITALILAFVLAPAHDIASGLALVLAGVLSSAVKFLIAPFGRHVFNPAAFAAAFVSLLGLLPSTWWVGSSALWPFTFVLALAIILKIRRHALVVSFAAAVAVVQGAQFVLAGQPLIGGFASVVGASPFLFLGGVMLTEPSTMPPRRAGQAIFGAVVGGLFVLAPEFGPLICYPEVALLAGNLYAYAIMPKRRYRLTLSRIEEISTRVHTYVFTPDRPVMFAAGQYMEVTLVGVPDDGRGNRRSFTIASSPTEQDIRIGVKYYDPSSTFKSAFSQLRQGDSLYAGQVAGSFTLPGPRQKLALIAGGIGITPFRSMVKQIIDEGRQADIVVLYAAASADELAYREVFEAAAVNGVRLEVFVPDAGATGERLTPATIAAAIPDHGERTFMVSGSEAMVRGVRRYLREIGVRRTRIRTDRFTGY